MRVHVLAAHLVVLAGVLWAQSQSARVKTHAAREGQSPAEASQHPSALALLSTSQLRLPSQLTLETGWVLLEWWARAGRPSLGRTRLAGLLRVLLRRLAVSLLRPSLAGRRLRRGHGC